MLTLVIGLNFACLLLIPAFLSMSSAVRWKALGFWSEHVWKDIGRGLLACLLIAPPVYGLMAFISLRFRMVRRPHPLEKMIVEGLTWQNVVVATLAAVVAAPLAEELIFRGVLLGWLTKLFSKDGGRKQAVEFSESFGEAWARPDPAVFEFESPYQPPLATLEEPPTTSEEIKREPSPFAFWMPNVLTSILFAGLHAEQWPAPIPLFFLSLGLGYLTQKSASIVPSIALHACFNGISTALLFVAMAFGIKPS